MFKYIHLSTYIFLLFLLSSEINAQDTNSKFDKRYTEVFQKMGGISKESSEKSVDSLIKISSNPYQKSKSLMLKAIMNIISDHKSEALFYAIESEKEANESGVLHMQVRTAGFLSTLFIDAGLYEEALVYINKAERVNEKMKDSPEYSITQLKINDERAFYEYQNNNYKKAIVIREKSKALIDKMDKEDQPSHLLYHHESMGANYIGLEAYEKAREHFNISLTLMESTSNKLLEPKLYNGLAQVELHAKNFPKALEYLNKAADILKSNQEDGVQIMIYKSFANYYKAIGMHKEALEYEELYSNAFNEKTITTQKVFNELIKKSNETSEINQTKINYLISFSILALLLIVVLVIRLIYTRKRERIKYEELIKNINSDLPLNIHSQNETNIENKKELFEEQKKGPIMSKETEERILDDLAKLETELFFTQKDISISLVAIKLNTNIRYLSYVINANRGKSFNNYINELRIRYIIKKIQTNPQYLDYKLSYLAEEAGFSSHSKFASIFKVFTGLSPSTFINHIRKENSKKEHID